MITTQRAAIVPVAEIAGNNMRITVKQLREMIRESFRQEMSYAQAIKRVGRKLYKVDDDGREYYGRWSPDDPDYGDLEDGETRVYEPEPTWGDD